MYFVYILYSTSGDRYYIGCTNDIDGRIRRHNTKHKGCTGSQCDWTLVWKMEFEEKSAALAEEKKIKAWKNRMRIKELIAGK
jgi:putative endonuclease